MYIINTRASKKIDWNVLQISLANHKSAIKSQIKIIFNFSESALCYKLWSVTSIETIGSFFVVLGNYISLMKYAKWKNPLFYIDIDFRNVIERPPVTYFALWSAFVSRVPSEHRNTCKCGKIQTDLSLLKSFQKTFRSCSDWFID